MEMSVLQVTRSPWDFAQAGPLNFEQDYNLIIGMTSKAKDLYNCHVHIPVLSRTKR